MALKPIKLRLDGEELHLVPTRELDRWGGYLNGKRAAFELITPENIADIRRALMCPRSVDTKGVYTELYKQLEDRSALFFEIPPEDVPFDAPPITDIKDLTPKDGTDDRGRGPGPHEGLHWIEVTCVSAKGESFAGAKARIRLPDGRSAYVTLDARSSVRFDDLTEGGTVHFELSGDAQARGSLPLPGGTRYELGKPIGLSTQRQHILVVHPNPRAFVSAALFVDEEPVTTGSYTLSTKGGDHGGALDGDAARAEGFPLPSQATYAFENVLLPPRPEASPQPDPGTDGATDGSGLQPDGTDGVTPPLAPVPPDGVRITLRLDDGTPLPASIELQHARTDAADGHHATFEGVEGAAVVVTRGAMLGDSSAE